MKNELKLKFLQHLNQKKQNEGFTLIELLVVIIIIGILAAIALPSFLSQANKAKQSEAKTYIGSINKSQQAFYTEKSRFTTDINETGVGLKTQTANYIYQATAANGGTTANVWTGSFLTTDAGALKTYSGEVGLIAAGGGEVTSVAVLCEQTTAAVAPTKPNTSGTGCNNNQILVGGTQ
ncbi:MAG: prepilin-type N-terminal cleavage/methylation domain-containing protein [Symploca sp. SIO3E6]|nr:prepilin-type N-terminal cleavage/methylation domain-containing protein [Caldora sp. SIO3E6]